MKRIYLQRQIMQDLMVNDRTTFRTAFRTWKENVQRSKHMAYIQNHDDGADADDTEPAEAPDCGSHAEEAKEVHIVTIARRVSGLGANVDAIRKSSQVCCSDHCAGCSDPSAG